MNKYQNMSSSIIIILILIIWTFSACNFSDKKHENNKKVIIEDTTNTKNDKATFWKDTSDTENNKTIVLEDTTGLFLRSKESKLKRDKLRAIGIHSYFYRDTFYIYADTELLIAKKYFKPSINNPDINKVIETMYWIEQDKIEGNEYISLYVGDATPYKSYLIDLQTNRIIIENDNYQTYLGSSSNKNYHLFETGTAASVRSFAIFNADNELLKRGGYYTSLNDKNQLKWIDNKVYYYDDYRQGTVLPNNLPKLKVQEVYVQKYYWTNERDSITNEFFVAFME